VDARLTQLLDLLDRLDGEGQATVGTSVRLPTSLREAAVLATDMGLTRSVTELTVGAVRDALEAFAQRSILDAHYQAHPEARPSLGEVALATAQLDGNPLADRPDLVERAASEVVAVKADPSPDDVLVYAAGLAAATAA